MKGFAFITWIAIAGIAIAAISFILDKNLVREAYDKVAPDSVSNPQAAVTSTGEKIWDWLNSSSNMSWLYILVIAMFIFFFTRKG